MGAEEVSGDCGNGEILLIIMPLPRCSPSAHHQSLSHLPYAYRGYYSHWASAYSKIIQPQGTFASFTHKTMH